MTTNEEMRAEFRAQLTIVEEEGRKLAKLPLPSFWDDPSCDCHGDHLQVVEPGYWRWEDVDDVDVDLRRFHASTDGWDSMSEHGTCEYVECMSCGKLWEVPVELDWD